MNAVFWPPNDATESGEDGETGDSKYDSFAPMFAACDVVVVEGDSHTHAPKIEVWRQEVSDSPMAASDSSITAVITDDQPVALSTPIWPRADVAEIATRVQAVLQE